MGKAAAGVMHMVDTLDLGGAETVAVNLANRLPRDRYRSYLCSTRRGGPLASSLRADVPHLNLERKSRFDLGAIFKLRKFIREQEIGILHVHATSLFLGRIVSLLQPHQGLRILWHDHYGRCELNDRSASLYRFALGRAAGVIAVNQRLVDWACRDLGMSSERVWYVPNFVALATTGSNSVPMLPGCCGSRIVCVANMRPQKDHVTLIRAMNAVRNEEPKSHLILVGAPVDAEYTKALRREVAALSLEDHVTFLGQSCEVASILRTCDIGVLSSISEGLPLSLLEYGAAGISTIATSVGQCAEVLDHGRAGVLVPPSSPEALAAAIIRQLRSPEERAENGRKMREFVGKTFDPAAIVDKICSIYDIVLSEN